MNATVLYSLQTILSAGVFILIYRLFVRNTNAYNWNRFYLLATMIVSLLLPHINISSWFTVEKPILIYTTMIDLGQAITITPGQQVQQSFSISEILMFVYWAIVGLLLLRFGYGLIRIYELAINSNYQKSGNLRLYPIQRKTTFSFFNYIFIQPDHWDKPVTEFILRHEEAHVKHMHSLDNLLTELILVFGWFNPFYYTYRRDLHLLHECQADQQVINSGCDTSTYHQLLLNEVSGNLTYIIVNQFSYSLIKRRFKMISKNKQSRLAGFRILLAIPTAFALLLLFSFTSLEKTTSLLNNKILQPTMQAVQSSMVNLQNPQQKPIVKKQVKQTIKFTPPLIMKDTDTLLEKKEDIDSHYPGGYSAWIDLVKKNINFKLLTPKIMGGTKFEVYVQFTVSENGDILNPTIARSMNGICDKEALRIIKLMPKWKPIIKDGKPVRLTYVLPIKCEIKFSEPKIDAFVAGSEPEYKGGYEELHQYIRKNTHYPESAKKQKIHGTVWVAAFINNDGKVSKVKLLKGIGGGCNEEALRVIREMPDWNPGKSQVPICRYLTVAF